MWGFQKSEIKILIFLCILLLAGSGIRIYQNRWGPLPKIREAHDPGKTEGIENEEIYFNQKISLNNATEKELERLPGIGPVLAQRIVQYRNTHNNFNSIEELKKVKGVGEKTVEKIKSNLTVD